MVITPYVSRQRLQPILYCTTNRSDIALPPSPDRVRRHGIPATSIQGTTFQLCCGSGLRPEMRRRN